MSDLESIMRSVLGKLEPVHPSLFEKLLKECNDKDFIGILKEHNKFIHKCIDGENRYVLGRDISYNEIINFKNSLKKK